MKRAMVTTAGHPITGDYVDLAVALSGMDIETLPGVGEPETGQVGFGVPTVAELSNATVSVRAPAPSLGPELVGVPGDWLVDSGAGEALPFDGWSHGGGQFTHDGSAAHIAGLYLPISPDLPAGSYTAALTIGGTTGTVEVSVGNSQAVTYDAGDGAVSDVFVNPTANANLIYILPSDDFDGTIDDDASVKANIALDAVVVQAADGGTALRINADDTAPVVPAEVFVDSNGVIILRSYNAEIKIQNQDLSPLADISAINLTAEKLFFLPDLAGDEHEFAMFEQVPQIVTGEIPTGAIDSVNTDFELNDIPAPDAVAVYLEGLRVSPADYTVTSNTITLNTPPTTGPLVVDYWYYGT